MSVILTVKNVRKCQECQEIKMTLDGVKDTVVGDQQCLIPGR